MQTTKCPYCNEDVAPAAGRCYRCGHNLVPETALPDADSVRVQRVGRLLARWRRTSKTLWDHAERLGSDNDRDAAAQLDGLIDELASELEAAGEEPTIGVKP